MIKIEKINLELFQYENANRAMKENIHNILSRFLADELLNNFISKFHKYMDKINIQLYIFLDLISSGNYKILSNLEVIKAVEKISKELYELLNKLINNPNDNDIKNKIIDFIVKSKYSKIEFIEDVKLGKNLFKKEDLNKIIDLLFIIKNIGNKTAHPNIDLQESLKIINMQGLQPDFNFESSCDEIIEKNFNNEIIIINGIPKEQNKFSSKKKNITFEDEIFDKNIMDEDNHLYYHSCDYKFNNVLLDCEYDLFNSLKKYETMAKNEIWKNMEEVIKKQISRFNNSILKKNGNIKEIIEVIFKENDEKIFNENLNILRTLYYDIDNIIKKPFNIDLKNKFNEEKESIDSFMDLLEIIQIELKEFEKLKIIKHKNLDEYINHKITENEENFSKYKLFIEKLEKKKFSLTNIDSLGNEIIAEVCFLLLDKIFLKEIKNLQSIINSYEREIIKNILYEETLDKLKEIYELVKQYFKVTPFNLTQIIKNNLIKMEKNNGLKLDKIKNILCNLFKDDIALNVNNKLNQEKKLFYFQNKE